MMTLVSAKHQLEQVVFSFDGAGELEGVEMTVNLAIVDDAILDGDGNPIEWTRARKLISVWGDLTAGQKTAAGVIAKRLVALAGAI